MSQPIRADDAVLVTLEDGKTYLVRPRPGRQHSTHKGAIDHDEVIGREWGSVLITNTGAEAYLLRPRWIDRMMKVRRRTNIMYPKDVAWLVAALGVRAGSRVVEIGSGSGAMTMALATAVQPGGEVFTYDRREEFLALARDNCEAAGVIEGVTYRTRQVGDALEPDVDAVFTDVPEPWSELAVIHAALRGSGRFAAGTPTFNQAERLAEALGAGGFRMVETTEFLVRQILARHGRTRPAHRMIGHTQLLTTAVKVTGEQQRGREAAEPATVAPERAEQGGEEPAHGTGGDDDGEAQAD